MSTHGRSEALMHRSADAPMHAMTFAYIGNEVDAAGFRLAGIAAQAPRAGEVAAAFVAAQSASEVLFLSTQAAAQLPRALLDSALAAERPLLVLLPDGAHGDELDPAARVRVQLGLEA